MQAQYQATINDLMDQGKSETEATAIAEKQHAIAQAQINAGAEGQLASLRDQLSVAGARNVQEGITAQQQVTFNDLLRQGVDIEIARGVASQQAENAEARINVQMDKQVQSSQDQLDLARAAGTADKARVQSDIAYRNAMQAGATSSQAAAISVNTMQVGLMQAAQSANAMADAEERAQRASQGVNLGRGGDFGNNSTNGQLDNQNQPHSFAADPNLNVHYPNGGGGMRLSIPGMYDSLVRQLRPPLNADDIAQRSLTSNGIDSAISTLMKHGDTAATKDVYYRGSLLGAAQPAVDATGSLQNLYDLKNAQTTDKGAQASNLQEFQSWLQTQPETIARDQKIVSLQQSIDQLKNATDANTAATSATLNPLYSQGHGALAIGYYKAAAGLDMVASGPASGDQVPFHAMVNGGERIQITPKGQSSNDNSAPVRPTTTIVQNFDFRGAQSNSRRSSRQYAQGFGQTAALILIYGIEFVQAAEMVKPLILLAGDILQRGLIDHLAASQGVSAEQAEVMIADARAK